MNAHAQAYMAETPITVRRALKASVALYDNDDFASRETVLEAIAAGRSAFWSTAKYHNATACMLLDRVNRMPMDEALAFITDPHKLARMADFLDTLVPLNAKAENALALAYARHTPTWREEPELAMRRMRDCRAAA